VNKVSKLYLMQHSNCIVCNEPLIYKRKSIVRECYYCGIQNKTDVVCANDHYVCNECSRRDMYAIIETECLSYEGIKPFELAERILSSNKLQMHGAEHHLIVPAVMLTVYLNHQKRKSEKKELIEVARNRALRLHDGICASHGTCAAAMGVGMFFSIILDVNELQTHNYAYINMASANVLLNVARYGGPRCCKRSTFLGILQIRNLLADDYNIILPIPDQVKCNYVALNKECTKENCLFY